MTPPRNVCKFVLIIPGPMPRMTLFHAFSGVQTTVSERTTLVNVYKIAPTGTTPLPITLPLSVYRLVLKIHLPKTLQEGVWLSVLLDHMLITPLGVVWPAVPKIQRYMVMSVRQSVL